MAFVDLVDAMIAESRAYIDRLQEYAEDPSLSRQQRHAIREVTHTEGLRLDMLQRVLSEWQGGS